MFYVAALAVPHGGVILREPTMPRLIERIARHIGQTVRWQRSDGPAYWPPISTLWRTPILVSVLGTLTAIPSRLPPDPAGAGSKLGSGSVVSVIFF